MFADRMTNRIALWFPLLCLCALLLTGCYVGQMRCIYNNTGQNGVIRVGGPNSKKQLPNGTETKMGWVAFPCPVYIDVGQETWIYEDVGAINFGLFRRNAPDQFQIEGNGAMYFIPTGLEMPVKVFPKQPKGYPKIPVIEKEKE